MRTKHHPLLSHRDKSRLWEKHLQSAVVRTIGGLFLAGIVLLFYTFGYIGPKPFKGGMLSCLFLIFMSIPSLYLTKIITKRLSFDVVSLLINLFEIYAFTSVIYYMGGVNAAFLLPCYAIVITRVGTVVPRRYPYFIAGLSVLAFAMMIAAQTFGLFSIQQISFPAMKDGIYSFLIIVTATGFLFGIAGITSFSAGVIKKARDATVAKNRELEASREKLEVYSRELRQSEQQYRRIFESIRTVYMEVDRHGIIIEISPSVERMTGFKRADVMGKSIFKAPYSYPDKIYFVAKDVLEQGEVRDREVPLFHTSGKMLTVSICARMVTDHNRPKGFVAVDISDVTARHMAESALRESEERYRMLIEKLQDVVFMLTPDGIIEFTSSASVSFGGYLPEDVEGRHFRDFAATEEELLILKDLFTETLTEKKSYGTEFQYKPKNGSCFYVEISATPIVTDGEVTRVLCLMRDISKRKHAEEQIRQLNQELMNIQEKERKRIALDLHDDVAQNLASLMLNCETFFDHYPDAPLELKNNMKHMSSVMKQSLTFIRNLSYELRPPALDQLGLVKTLSRYCEDFSRKNRIQVEFQAVGMAAFMFDPDTEISLYRIVQEALNNVKKHARAKHVEVKFTASVPDIFLRIIDDGIGFDVDDRLQSAINEKRMGIHSMTERVNFMGGKIKFLSKSDLGTTIRVTIPGDRFRLQHHEERSFTDKKSSTADLTPIPT